jgi:hypothetical protein
MVKNDMQVRVNPKQLVYDFYNLDLESRKEYVPRDLADDQKGLWREESGIKIVKGGTGERVHPFDFFKPILPDQNEKERIRRFFHQYVPWILVTPDPSGNPGTFSFYKKRHQVCWLRSKDYLDFADHWRTLRQLMDGILDRKLDLGLLYWFNNEITERFKHSLVLKKPDGEIIGLDPFHEGTLEEWKADETITTEPLRYGIEIGSLLMEVHRSIASAIKNPQMFKRCGAKETSRHPACQNILPQGGGPGRNKDYCSTQCRKRHYMAVKRKGE